MSDASFALLFRAVRRIHGQLKTADFGLKQLLAEELVCLQHLATKYAHHLTSLNAEIDDLFCRFDLTLDEAVSEAPQAGRTKTPLAEAEGETLPLRASFEPKGSYLSSTAPVNLKAVDGMSNTAKHLPPNSKFDTAFAKEWANSAFRVKDEAAAAFRQGLAYYDLFMFSHAAKSLERAVEQWDDPIARTYLAAALAVQNHEAEAMAHVRFIRHQTKDGTLLCATNEIEASLHVKACRFVDAIRCLREITEIAPDFQDVWFNLAVCYTKQNEFQAAKEAVVRALEVQPGDVEALHLLASLHCLLGDLHEAYTVCQFGLSKFPHHGGLLRVYSELLQKQGQFEKSIAIAKRMIHLQPDSFEAWSQVAWLRLQMDDAATACAVLKKFLSMHHTNSAAMVQLGILLTLAGELDQAERVLLHEDVTSIHDPLAFVALGRISASRHDASQASNWLLRAIELSTSQPIKRLASYYYGVTLYEASRFEEAEIQFEAAAALGQDNPAIQIALAEARLARGKATDNSRSDS